MYRDGRNRKQKAAKTKVVLHHIPADTSDEDLEAFAKKIREGQKAYNEAHGSQSTHK